MTHTTSSKSGSAGPLHWKWALVLALAVIIIGALLSSCANKPHAQAHKPSTVEEPSGHQEGLASWYGPGFRGKKTANGERFNPKHLTAAHRTLPFGTKVRVVNLANDKDVIVRINDRGPFIRGRVIDLSKRAAQLIAMMGSGTARVRIEPVADDTVIEEATSAPVKFIKGRKKIALRRRTDA